MKIMSFFSTTVVAVVAFPVWAANLDRTSFRVVNMIGRVSSVP